MFGLTKQVFITLNLVDYQLNVSCKCKCKFDSRECNSNQKWNIHKC